MANLIESIATPSELSSEITRRAMLGLLILLTNICSSIILQPVEDGYLRLILVSLFEVPVMVIIALLFGNKSIACDINEFNCYGLLLHLIYIPAYLHGVSSTYHNIGIKILLVLCALRSVYFGPRIEGGDFKGLGVFGILAHVRQLFQLRQLGDKNAFFRYWQHLLFFGAAIPLWCIMIRSSDIFITGTIAGLMVFIFIMANTMQLELNKFRSVPEIHAPNLRVSDSSILPDQGNADVLRSTVRDVATQFLHAYKNTHPSMKNLNVAVAKYVQRTFPDDRVFGATSISARRTCVLTQLAELMVIAREQLQQNAELIQAGKGLNLDVDISRLTEKFDASLKFELDETGMIAFMDYVMGQPPLELADSTFVLACDVLITAWLRCLFSNGSEVFAQEYASVDFVTKDFLARFMPNNDSMQ
jgi:hypothetical protein